MSPLLVLDVETTGLVNPKLPPEDPRQPNALSIAAILVDGEWQEVASVNVIVRPEDDWQMSAKAESVNSISRAYATMWGVKSVTALSTIVQLATKTRRIAAFNGAFDRSVLTGMLLRAGADPAASIARPMVRWIDVMDLATIPCGLAKEDGSPKWPKLAEAVATILGREHVGHRAMDDARATLEVYRALVERGLVLEAAA